MDIEKKRASHKAANRKWYLANRDKSLARSMAFAQKNPSRHLLRAMRGSAKVRGHECTISLDELETLLAPMTCSMTGLPLIWDKSTLWNEFAPSPDRIDNSKGYVSGNVRIVAWIYNRMRGTLSDQEFVNRLKLLLDRLT